MGRSWIGFQPATKPIKGNRVVVQERIVASCSVATLLPLLTTAEGLTSWLAPVTKFTLRRGGDIDFMSDNGVFTGSYSLVETPKHITLITDRHGEIDIRIDVDAVPVALSIGITCVAPEGDAEDAARARGAALIEQLRRCVA